jgi:hypothetical protein
MLSVLLSAVLIVLVLVLLIQVISLSAAVGRQEAAIRDLKSQGAALETALREVKNLARVTVSVYQEPGKRPQKVIAVHDVGEDGKLEIKKLTILPLEEP